MSLGLHFSREIRNCVPEDIADCEIERVWECPDEDDMDNLVFLPNKENCQKYYLCLGGEAHPLSCAKGLHWSINEEACMEEDEAECEFEDGEGIEECPDEGIKLISHPYNCEMYVLCVGGERIKRDCAPGNENGLVKVQNQSDTFCSQASISRENSEAVCHLKCQIAKKALSNVHQMAFI